MLALGESIAARTPVLPVYWLPAGKYRQGDENLMKQSPLAVCNCFAEAVDMIVMATTQPIETQNDE